MNFRLRLARAFRTWLRTPSKDLSVRPKIFGCGCLTVLAAVAAIVISLVAAQCASSSSPCAKKSGCPSRANPPAVDQGEALEEADAAPRLILSRWWFDKLPQKPTDTIDLWVFFGGGIGLHETGSRWRGSFDLFEFERAGAKIEGKFFQDKKRFKTAFNVRSCDGHEPFDMCLTLEDFGGKKLELYGFGHDDEMEKAIPGSKAKLASARALSAQPKEGTE